MIDESPADFASANWPACHVVTAALMWLVRWAAMSDRVATAEYLRSRWAVRRAVSS
jgi:hypothetical protein